MDRSVNSVAKYKEGISNKKQKRILPKPRSQFKRKKYKKEAVMNQLRQVSEKTTSSDVIKNACLVVWDN